MDKIQKTAVFFLLGKPSLRVIVLTETKCKIRFIYVIFDCKRKKWDKKLNANVEAVKRSFNSRNSINSVNSVIRVNHGNIANHVNRANHVNSVKSVSSL